MEYEKLPPGLRQAVEHVIQPTYRELVLESPSALARSLGLTIVHLLWLEAIEQLDMDLPDFKQQDPFLKSVCMVRSDRSRQIERHLRLLHTKLKATELLSRLETVTRNANAPNGSRSPARSAEDEAKTNSRPTKIPEVFRVAILEALKKRFPEPERPLPQVSDQSGQIDDEHAAAPPALPPGTVGTEGTPQRDSDDPASA